MSRSRQFTSELWSEIAGVYRAILDQPFIRGLTDGSLDLPAFKFYIVQDSLYLGAYARALSLAAAKAPGERDVAMFNTHAAGAIEVERALHSEFFKGFGISPEVVRSTPMAPTNRAYTSYLLAVAYGRPFSEGLAALLPCYWIYWEVGKVLIRKGSPNALYRRWIETYGGEAFGKVVEEVLALTNRTAETISPAARKAMTEHFVTTSRYEWMFWDMAHRQEAWPI